MIIVAGVDGVELFAEEELSANNVGVCGSVYCIIGGMSFIDLEVPMLGAQLSWNHQN